MESAKKSALFWRKSRKYRLSLRQAGPATKCGSITAGSFPIFLGLFPKMGIQPVSNLQWFHFQFFSVTMV
jgi:hypothetical protein